MKFRNGSWSMNLTASSNALSGALGIPMAFGSVFALAMSPVSKAPQLKVVRRRRGLALAA